MVSLYFFYLYIFAFNNLNVLKYHYLSQCFYCLYYL